MLDHDVRRERVKFLYVGAITHNLISDKLQFVIRFKIIIFFELT